MSSRSDIARLRDALEALEALNRLKKVNQEPSSATNVRRHLDTIFEEFEAAPLAARFTRRPSGAPWVSEFPDIKATADLVNGFRAGVENFIAAMRAAGARVLVSSTRRPQARAYLMHYSWRVAKQEITPANVPAMSGVDIEWVHATDGASRQAAQDMVDGYGLVARPSLTSRHTEGRAIDMTISWSGDLTIKDAQDATVVVKGTPRTGENADLIKTGRTFGVIKAIFAGDPPHWSDDGH